ncbi:DUF1801 domain-containing protein [bacterium]|nr:MAG: DUF1801 domain-containing protein [bacterium]
MAELKTKATEASVTKFLNGTKDARRRRDCETILELMRKATGAEPKMWGASIVGFGDCHYVYESGREGDWFLMGFSPRKQNLVLYSMVHFAQFEALLKQLGSHKLGKGCLYIKNLQDVHLPALNKLITKCADLARKNCKQLQQA